MRSLDHVYRTPNNLCARIPSGRNKISDDEKKHPMFKICNNVVELYKMEEGDVAKHGVHKEVFGSYFAFSSKLNLEEDAFSTEIHGMKHEKQTEPCKMFISLKGSLYKPLPNDIFTVDYMKHIFLPVPSEPEVN